MLELLLLSDITDPDAIAWRSTVEAAGGSVSPHRARDIESLIKALKAGQAWWLRDDYAAYAGAENVTQALVTLKRRAAQVANNSPTLGTTGFTGNISAFIDLKWNPASGTWQYTQDSAEYGCWVSADPGVSTSKRLMGNDDDNWSEIQFRNTGNIIAGINQAVIPTSITPPNRLGLIAVTRTGSATNALIQNGVQLVAGTQASIAIPSRNFYALAANSSGGAVAPVNSTIAMTLIGAPLSLAQRQAEWQAWRAFMNLYGVP
ncbi:MAG TPA: hypothetical protein VGJ56_11245 [Reyranella sp.]